MNTINVLSQIPGMGTLRRPEMVLCAEYPRLVFYRGLVQSFMTYMAELDRPEKIVASANKLRRDGVIELFVGYPKARHFHLIALMCELFGEEYDPKFVLPYNQGFLTSHGRYVGRIEACRIAQAQNQLLEGALKHQELFSEAIW